MTDIGAMAWMVDVWPPIGFHGVLWLGFLVVIAVLAVALIRDWRRG